ncbi:MAG: hypothetical protein ACJ78Q_01655, partial [Chloroflexia bacterium]
MNKPLPDMLGLGTWFHVLPSQCSTSVSGLEELQAQQPTAHASPDDLAETEYRLLGPLRLGLGTLLQAV